MARLIEARTALVPMHEVAAGVLLEMNVDAADWFDYTVKSDGAANAYGTTPAPTAVLIEGRVGIDGDWVELAKDTADRTTPAKVDITGVTRLRVRQGALADNGPTIPTHVRVSIAASNSGSF